MTPQEVKRKLTAILSADVKGYSRLMGEDEVGTIHTLNIYKETISNLIQYHHRRVVDAPGDDVLAEFASVVDAVQCAVEIQKELKNRNTQLPENRRKDYNQIRPHSALGYRPPAPEATMPGYGSTSLTLSVVQ
jgi:adenylate cyclase